VKETFAGAYRTISGVVAAPISLATRALSRLGIEVTAAGRYDLRTPTLEPSSLEIDATQLPKRVSTSSGRVRTSIIIPVFNKAAFTFRCLGSLMREIDVGETEIIVVDNASTDETPQVLSQFGDLVRVMRNEENRGFVDACNQGAAAARGNYLVFLNNDTVVLSGWLEHLIETIAIDESVGLAGSMFLYPDGKIQEAGAIVWKNGEAHHYGWGARADDRRFNFAREVDYCSAASVVIRKELFERLGGFDRRFAPAYYEDIDLCFGVRSLGYKVIYQPASRVIHYEGATAGRDGTKSWKRYQVLNREKFVEKWREVLQREHLDKNLKRLEFAANRRRGPNLIVFDERVPTPDRDAGSGRMFFILKTLASWANVVFIPFYRLKEERYEAALWKEGIQTAFAKDWQWFLKQRHFAAAIVSRPEVAEAMIPRLRRVPGMKIVFDMVDAHFIRVAREARVTGDHKMALEARRYRQIETQLAQVSDFTWCSSSDDKHAMEREVPGKAIAVLPTIHETRVLGPPFENRSGLLFIGNMAHRPNHDGMIYFLGEIYPLIRQALPDITLQIVGDNVSPIAALASEHVKIEGYVPDVEPLLRSCRVFIAPIRFGAGLKGKIGEAMAYGLPVVTTSIGAEGFGLTHKEHIMIGDDPERFAAAVVDLYNQPDLWRKISCNGRRLIQENFSPQTVAETIKSSLQEAIDG
jgi:O-antigen biosynthesis protein